MGLRRHRGQHHVGVRQLRGDPLERRRRAPRTAPPAASRTRSSRPLGRPVDHDDAPRRIAGAGRSDSARKTPRPMSPAPTTTTRASRSPAPSAPRADGHRGVGERRRPLADAGLGADALAGLQGVAEQRREDRAARALLLGPLEGAPHLADDLGLAGHHRLEARRHGEEVRGDVVVEADQGVERQLLDRDAGLLGEDVVDLGHRVVEAVHHRVDLGPQAGREHDRLLHVAPVAEGAQRLVQVRVGDRRGLEQRQRGLRVLQPYDDDGHSESSWVGAQFAGPAARRASRRRGRGQARSWGGDIPTARMSGHPARPRRRRRGSAASWRAR